MLLGASLGVGGTVYTENQKLEQKIPIPVQEVYNHIQTCIFLNRINDEYYTKKIRDNCFCVVEKISKSHDIRFIKLDSKEMKSYYNQCANQ